MKPVAAPSQMRECDRITIEEIGVPGLVLMESASRAVAEEVERLLEGDPVGKRVTLFCGKGNNGGDGLACARHLHNRGADVRAVIAGRIDAFGGDARTQAELLKKVGGEIIEAESVDDVPPEALFADVVVDALLGSGAAGEPTGFYRDLCLLIRELEAPVVAVDIPTGVDGATGSACEVAVEAVSTVTFGMVKPGLLFSPGRDRAGSVTVADIGIPPFVATRAGVRLFTFELEDARKLIPRRASDAHKGDAGYVFMLAGSPGLTGAAALAAEASVRAGAGLVVVGIPQSLNPILEAKLTEAMTEPLPENPGSGGLSYHGVEKAVARIRWADAIAIGPGMGRDPDTGALLLRILPEIDKPLVIDADGLNLIAGRRELLGLLPRGTVITPHPGELARLTGGSVGEIVSDPVKSARAAAAEFNVVVHLKGAPSVTALPDGEAFINTTGNSGMATGGSGDVLTGIIVSLLAAGLPPAEAACAGAWLHGRAGDLAAAEVGRISLAAGDLITNLPGSFASLA